MSLDFLKPVLIPIHQEGHKFIAIFAGATAIFYMMDWTLLTFVGVVLTVWCGAFFRNPTRHTPTKDGLIISPADGVVQLITQSAPPAELGMGDKELTRVSVFMNVFNVHINRAPISGVVKAVEYKPGKFLNADLDKASSDNERLSFVMEHSSGKDIAFVQIAGLVARRIKGFVKEGDVLSVGERFGLIRFGSRVDVYLPKGVKPMVALGQTMIAGETVLADLNAKKQEDYLIKSE
ncbi:MAG: phosphatidylserine decarboxylase [Alphaproteobacteria bacterium]